MNEELTPVEEQALDALLAEVHDQSAPPDLSGAILAQLGHLSTPDTSVGSSSDSGIRIAAVPRKTKRSSTGIWLAAVAAVAATIIGAIWIQGIDNDDGIAKVPNTQEQNETPGAGPTEVANDQSQPATSQLEEGPLRTIPPIVPESISSEVPRGVPMIVKDSPTEDVLPSELIRPQFVKRGGSKKPAAPIRSVAGQLEKDWGEYWTAIGIHPTDEASADETAARISQVLNTSLTADVVSDPQKLRDAVATNSVAQQLAAQWLEQITDGGTRRLGDSARTQLVDEVASGLRSQSGFDEKFVELISGKSDQSSAFYNAISTSGHDSMVRRLASVTMNVDLRCTKCHDALIEGNGRQDSYWSFAGFMKQSLKRSGDLWSVVSSSGDKPTFYELPDGRQRFATPGVDSKWMRSVGNGSGNDIQTWATNLNDSPEFARALVNSMWQLVHGRPLRGHVIDTITAPHHEALEKIEHRLVDDLIDSDFDASRLLALVVSSPVARRSVPGALEGKNQLTASQSEIREAMNLVDAFAASIPVRTKMGLPKRVQIAMKSVGGSLQGLSDGGTLLANIAELGNPKRKRPSKNPKLPEVTGYPYKASSLPVQWLSSIESYESRVDHLGYLAGLSDVPKPVHEAAAAIRKAEGGDELALHRVWWMLRP